ncbi:MAG TPA: hypothetical protein VN089_07065 [Duganella sp.]|nr:hypothetical protein [Duganella sp.]
MSNSKIKYVFMAGGSFDCLKPETNTRRYCVIEESKLNSNSPPAAPADLIHLRTLIAAAPQQSDEELPPWSAAFAVEADADPIIADGGAGRLLACDYFKRGMDYAIAASATQPVQQPAAVVGLSVEMSQFLTDVTTAAGLLSHGRQDKGLADRIGRAAFSLRTAPVPAAGVQGDVVYTAIMEKALSPTGYGAYLNGDPLAVHPDVLNSIVRYTVAATVQPDSGRDAALVELADPWVSAVRSADNLCPCELSTPDKWRWKAAHIQTALAAHPAPSSDAVLLAREQRDAQSLASLLAKERARFEFLHSTNRDAEGWEWGVARVRVVDGKVEYLWGASDHSDIDAIVAAHPANGAQAGLSEITISRAAYDVLAERRHQIEKEGYDTAHDDEHVNDEIAAYATFYAMPPGARDWTAAETGYGATWGEAIIPENWGPAKPGDRRGELVKGGALILAEIERLDRAEGMKDGKG